MTLPGVMAVTGQVLLIILGILVLILAVVLLVPIRYAARGSIHDPAGAGAQEAGREVPAAAVSAGSAEPANGLTASGEAAPGQDKAGEQKAEKIAFDVERILSHTEAEFHFSWLLHLVSGGIAYPWERRMVVRVAFVRFDAGNLLKRSLGKKKSQPGEENNTKKKEKKAETFPHKVIRIVRDLSYCLEILQKPYSEEALSRTGKTLAGLGKLVLPRRWRIEGCVGFGDPEKAGRMMGILGMLIPVTAGHVDIEPEFMAYRMDVEGYAKGHVTILSLLIAVLRLAMDRDFRHMAAMLRQRPSVRRKHTRARQAA